MSETIETTRPTIWFAMEFHGNGDAMFGGNGADWALYKTDEGREFMSAADAQRRQLVKAYFTNPTEAAISGEVYSKRGGSISACCKLPRLLSAGLSVNSMSEPATKICALN